MPRNFPSSMAPSKPLADYLPVKWGWTVVRLADMFSANTTISSCQLSKLKELAKKVRNLGYEST